MKKRTRMLRNLPRMFYNAGMEQLRWKQACLECIEAAEAAFLTTIGEDGFPRTRAMLNLRNGGQYPQQVSFFANHREDLLLYFSTNTSSLKLAQIRLNPRACAYYCLPALFQGVMLAGALDIVDDSALRHALWSEGWQRYYPQGPDDPDHSILRLRPSLVEGWIEGTRFTFRLPASP
ncbi:MAG: pyridoxamine 5'-phosphate oxidase family protein [Coprothermobacterota bacterium]|nr:pyridoxamine 5'-phosphate oxidase family protein [Coprothermobacterota bacterium]